MLMTYFTWRLGGLAVARWTTDHYHPCSNLGVGISEGCFTTDFASLPLEVAQTHLAYRKIPIIIIIIIVIIMTYFKHKFISYIQQSSRNCSSVW